jgi:hypothetical protein
MSAGCRGLKGDAKCRQSAFFSSLPAFSPLDIPGAIRCGPQNPGCATPVRIGEDPPVSDTVSESDVPEIVTSLTASGVIFVPGFWAARVSWRRRLRPLNLHERETAQGRNMCPA